MRGLVRTVVLVAAMAFAATASAQNYPSGPVKLIVPVPAGGVTDVMARIVGQRLQQGAEAGDEQGRRDQQRLVGGGQAGRAGDDDRR